MTAAQHASHAHDLWERWHRAIDARDYRLAAVWRAQAQRAERLARDA